MRDKKKILAISALITGIITLVGGVIFLIVSLNRGQESADGEFLVEVGGWSLEGEPGVIWNFTEIGKGKLTTNNHINDYDFVWAIEDDKLLIETDWLYDLEDEYEYTIDRGGKVLTIKDNDDSYRFTAIKDDSEDK